MHGLKALLATVHFNAKLDIYLVAKFDHNTPEGIKKLNLSQVRLCFQVFLPNKDNRYEVPLAPVVTVPIVDKSKLQCVCSPPPWLVTALHLG